MSWAEGAGIAPAAGEFVAVDGLPHRAPVGQGRDAHPEKFPRAPGGVPLQPRQRPLTIRAEQGVPLRQEPAAEGTAGREQEVEERAPSSRNISPFRSGLPRGHGSRGSCPHDNTHRKKTQVKAEKNDRDRGKSKGASPVGGHPCFLKTPSPEEGGGQVDWTEGSSRSSLVIFPYSFSCS